MTTYERLMLEAKAEYDAFMKKKKTLSTKKILDHALPRTDAPVWKGRK